MTSAQAPNNAPTGSLTIRPPQQQRSREAWVRVLDAGISLLESGGYEAFTIAAVCEIAQVVPRAIYARADSKDALFLAVYEHGIARVQADQAVLEDETRWQGLSSDQLAKKVVRDVAGIFARNAGFLKPVVLLSAAHPEVTRRGAAYSQELGDLFTSRLLQARADIDQPDPEVAVRAIFNTVFSTLVLRVAYGPGFAVPGENEEAFIETLGTIVSRYLFR